MAINPKLLANGQLPSTKGTLYTVPAGAVAYIKYLSCFNTGGGSNTVNIYAKRSASRVIGHATLNTLEQMLVIDKDAALTLEAGDVIEGDATNATEVDYVITGAEEGENIVAGSPFEMEIAISDESTILTTGDDKITFRMPRAISLTETRVSVNTVSSSGAVQLDVEVGGTSIYSTKLQVDAGSLTSVGSGTPPVQTSNPLSIADDAEVKVDIVTAGTGAKGLKLVLIGTRA